MPEQHYLTYNTDFKQHYFDSAASTDTTREVLSNGEKSATVTYVSTPTFNAYEIDLSTEAILLQWNTVKRITTACRAAEQLGAHIPTIAYNESGSTIALEEFHGNGIHNVSEHMQEHISKETLMWACAKMLVLGHWDLDVQNVLANPNGEFRIIDLQSLSRKVNPWGHQYTAYLYNIMTALPWEDTNNEHLEVELRTIALAQHLQNSSILDQHTTPEITDNIKMIPEIFPVGQPNENIDHLDIPPVDNTVLPDL